MGIQLAMLFFSAVNDSWGRAGAKTKGAMLAKDCFGKSFDHHIRAVGSAINVLKSDDMLGNELAHYMMTNVSVLHALVMNRIGSHLECR